MMLAMIGQFSLVDMIDCSTDYISPALWSLHCRIFFTAVEGDKETIDN